MEGQAMQREFSRSTYILFLSILVFVEGCGGGSQDEPNSIISGTEQEESKALQFTKKQFDLVKAPKWQYDAGMMWQRGNEVLFLDERVKEGSIDFGIHSLDLSTQSQTKIEDVPADVLEPRSSASSYFQPSDGNFFESEGSYLLGSDGNTFVISRNGDVQKFELAADQGTFRLAAPLADGSWLVVTEQTSESAGDLSRFFKVNEASAKLVLFKEYPNLVDQIVGATPSHLLFFGNNTTKFNSLHLSTGTISTLRTFTVDPDNGSLCSASMVERLNSRILLSVSCSEFESILVSSSGSDWQDLSSIASVPQEIARSESGTHLYFASVASSEQIELFKSDGTLAGTKSLSPGQSDVSLAGVVQGRLIYFQSNHLYSAPVLSNGDLGAKVDLGAYATTHTLSYWKFDQEIFFVARFRSDTGATLWKTNGLDSGTIRLQAMPGATVRQFLSGGKNVHYFSVYPNNDFDLNQVKVYLTDGSPSGTKQVMDLNSLGFGTIHEFNRVFVNSSHETNSNDHLYFVKTTPGQSPRLQRYNSFTAQIEDVVILREGISLKSIPDYMSVSNGIAYFLAGAGNLNITNLYELDLKTEMPRVVSDLTTEDRSIDVEYLASEGRAFYSDFNSSNGEQKNWMVENGQRRLIYQDLKSAGGAQILDASNVHALYVDEIYNDSTELYDLVVRRVKLSDGTYQEVRAAGIEDLSIESNYSKSQQIGVVCQQGDSDSICREFNFKGPTLSWTVLQKPAGFNSIRQISFSAQRIYFVLANSISQAIAVKSYGSPQIQILSTFPGVEISLGQSEFTNEAVFTTYNSALDEFEQYRIGSTDSSLQIYRYPIADEETVYGTLNSLEFYLSLLNGDLVIREFNFSSLELNQSQVNNAFESEFFLGIESLVSNQERDLYWLMGERLSVIDRSSTRPKVLISNEKVSGVGFAEGKYLISYVDDPSRSEDLTLIKMKN